MSVKIVELIPNKMPTYAKEAMSKGQLFITLLKRIKELQEFAMWMTGCSYDFCQHDYFCQQRDKLLKEENDENDEEVDV